ncbi:GroES-like protein [Mucidula mucida]|nr:GroES-like protein [Mucidula mucida]
MSIPTTMFSASYQPGNTELVINPAYPVPRPKAGEVLIKVSASGVCHSDVSLLSGSWLDERQYVLGHEICGVPIQLGQDVDPNEIHLGKLYTVNLLHPCTHGAVLTSTVGEGLDGGYAEYVIVPEGQLVLVPEGVSLEEAAIAGDAATTAYHAVYDSAGIKEGTNFKVLIFGIGGLGHLALQYAKHYGATVYAVDIKPEARALALELGAVEAYSLSTLNDKIKNGGFQVDISIDFAATSQTFQLAMSALTQGTKPYPFTGKAIMVGLSEESMNFSTLGLVTSGISVQMSVYGTRSSTEAALNLFATGAIRALITTAPLHDVNEVINKLRSFEVEGRMVLIPKLQCSSESYHTKSRLKALTSRLVQDAEQRVTDWLGTTRVDVLA